MSVMLAVIGFWLICSIVAAVVWTIGELLFGWVFQGRRVSFSLRTLLIATTLVALVLGVIVWLR
jgi:hypothetical protein